MESIVKSAVERRKYEAKCKKRLARWVSGREQLPYDQGKGTLPWKILHKTQAHSSGAAAAAGQGARSKKKAGCCRFAFRGPKS